MKNSSRHNPTKDVAAPGKQKQQWPANRAGTYTHLQSMPAHDPVSLGTKYLIAASDPGIKSSKHLLGKQRNSIPSSTVHST